MNHMRFSRREVMQAAAGVAGLSVLGRSALTFGQSQPSRPNVVFIYADDQPLEHLGCYGGNIPTPHIDGLARSGMRFARFYVSSPVCSPSRYTVLSGRYASRSKKLHGSCPPGGPVNIGWQPGVYGEAGTLPLLLKQTGYVTGCVGKWHQGGPGPLPGFDDDADPASPAVQDLLGKNYAAHVAAVKQCGFDYADGIYIQNTGSPSAATPNWLPKPWRVHNQEWVTAAALEFIDRHHASPFFLYMATTLTHEPSAQRSLETGDPRATPAGLLEKAPDVQRPRKQVLEAAAKAGVTRNDIGAIWLDDAVGAVLTRLKALGVADNTIVIYASDNGRRGKFTCYDAGARLPCIVRWPGRIKAGSVSDALIASIDFAPTLYEACGISTPKDTVVDGKSFLAELTGRGTYRRTSLFMEIACTRAVVSDQGLKYIATRFAPDIQEKADAGAKFTHNGLELDKSHHTYNAEKDFPGYFDKDQLYDLNNDPQEQNDLAAKERQVARLAGMKELLREYSRSLPHSFGEFSPER